MLWWRVYTIDGSERFLNLSEVREITFKRTPGEPLASDEHRVTGRCFVVMSNGDYHHLKERIDRRVLVDDVIMQSSRVERAEIDALKKAPKNQGEHKRREARVYAEELRRVLDPWRPKPGCLQRILRRLRRRLLRARLRRGFRRAKSRGQGPFRYPGGQ